MKIRISLAILFVAAMLFWQYFLKGYLLLPSAERFVDSFYDQYNRREFGYIYNVLADAKMRAHMQPPEFQYMMEDTHGKLGAVRETKRIGWKARFLKGQAYIFLTYKVKRAKAEATEKFTIVKKNNIWYVSDYVVRSAGFMNE